MKGNSTPAGAVLLDKLKDFVVILGGPLEFGFDLQSPVAAVAHLLISFGNELGYLLPRKLVLVDVL